MISKPIINPLYIWSGETPTVWDTIPKEWIFGQKPPYTTANYLQNQTDSALVHLYQNGIPQWDEFTLYQPGSRCLHQGVLYKFNGTLEAAGINPGTLPPTVWVPDDEKGGIAWSSVTDYSAGDLVIDQLSVPMKVYISTRTPNLNNPLSDTAYWQAVGSKYYNATTGGDQDGDGTADSSGLHNPSALEYPVTDVLPEIIGAIWTITGLGTDPITLEPNHYLMTAGSLVGQLVKDEDTFTWTSGATGSEQWLLTKKAVVTGEKGGILWSNTASYDLGDIVSYSGSGYIALVSTSGDDPSTNPSVWDKQADASSIVIVENNLTNSSATNALSANQGRLLKDAQDSKIEANNYAGSTIGGTVKMRVQAGVLYITNNGSDA